MTGAEYGAIYDMVRQNLYDAKRSKTMKIGDTEIEPYQKVFLRQEINFVGSCHVFVMVLEFDANKVEIEFDLDGKWHGSNFVFYTDDTFADVDNITDHVKAFIDRAGQYDPHVVLARKE